MTLTRISWDLWLEIFGLGSLVWDLWLGIFGLGSLAWDLWLRIFGLRFAEAGGTAGREPGEPSGAGSMHRFFKKLSKNPPGKPSSGKMQHLIGNPYMNYT